jgi:hypothetical protein
VEENKMVGHVAQMGEKKNAYKLLEGKPERKRPQLLGPSRDWVDNVKIDLGETGGVVWTGLIWHRIGTSGELL